jgi:hypothetical protein
VQCRHFGVLEGKDIKKSKYGARVTSSGMTFKPDLTKIVQFIWKLFEEHTRTPTRAFKAGVGVRLTLCDLLKLHSLKDTRGNVIMDQTASFNLVSERKKDFMKPCMISDTCELS